MPGKTEPGPPRYQVISITGKGLSGSTLLGHVLGTHPDVVNVGEINNLKRVYGHNITRLCSDGIAFDEHPVWQGVIKQLRAEGYEAPPFLRPRNPEKFIKNNDAVYHAISVATGKQFILEACKNSRRARGLLRYFDQSRLIYLIRDPRAYANSHKKRGASTAYIMKKVLSWNLKSLTDRWIQSAFPERVHVLSYECFTSRPAEEAMRILIFAGLPEDGIKLNYYDVPQPAFSGNRRMINEKSPIEFRTGYLSDLRWYEWLLYTILSFPANVLNGFPLGRKAPKTARVPENGAKLNVH